MPFVRACSLAELEIDEPFKATVEGLDVAVVRHGDDVFAIEDECSHAAVPLSEGEVEAFTIECFLHGSCFDLRTGKPTGPPATEPVNVYAVQVDGDDVLINVDTSLGDN